MPKFVSVVIPAHNEEAGIADVVRGVARVLTEAKIGYEVLVVDDGSTDGTARMARQTATTVLQHIGNRGYGASLKTGIIAAKYDTVCILDADGTYPVDRIPDLLAESEHADMVVGSRTGSVAAIPLLRRPAKWILNRLANFVTNSQIPDLNSGMRVFRRDTVLKYFHILPDQFSFTTTITMAMHCDKYVVSYIPIDYHCRTGRSKIVPWDAATFTVLILRTAMLFKPLRVFLPVAGICVLYAIVKGCWDLLITGDRNISTTAAVAMISALQLGLIGMLGDAIAIRLRYMSGTVNLEVRNGQDTEGSTAESLTSLDRAPTEDIMHRQG